MNTRENNPSAARYGATLEVRHLIDGEEVSGAGGRFESRNPSAPQDLVAVAPVATDEEVRAACRAAARAAPAWRNTPMPPVCHAVWETTRFKSATAKAHAG